MISSAWDEECLERERRDYLLTLSAAIVVYPSYAIIDHLLEPALERAYLVPRIVGTVAFVAAFLIVRRTRSLVIARAAFTGSIALTGPLVAAMLPNVDHMLTYLTGYSAFYWGCSALSWPIRWSLGVFGWQFAAIAVVFARDPGKVSGSDQLGAAFFLLTAVLLTTIAIHARWLAHRRAFEASFALAERNAELEATMGQLHDTQARLVAQEKLSALGRMLAGLSHEINNPINIIKNNLDPVREHVHELVTVLALAHTATCDDLSALRRVWEEREIAWRGTDLVDALDSMNVAVAHIQQIHTDLRTFIRGDVPDMTTADVGAGLRATISLLSRRVPATVQLVAEVDELPQISCHPGQLNQVWMNLLNNALDSVGTAGVVRVTARVAGVRIEVAVTDTGAGISREFRPRLFEPFATTKGPDGGTGLGLATSYQIIERHRGRLYLDDTQRAGARFVVELPT
ncbi:MAG TPA: ATP-binding protein [Kofleriaceae bacterium]